MCAAAAAVVVGFLYGQVVVSRLDGWAAADWGEDLLQYLPSDPQQIATLLMLLITLTTDKLHFTTDDNFARQRAPTCTQHTYM